MSAEAALLVQAWDSLRVPMLVADQDTTVLLMNRAAQESREGSGLAVGRRLHEVPLNSLHGDGRLVRESTRPVRRALAGEPVRDEEYILPGDGDGPPRRLTVSAHPVQGSGGATLALVSWRDVTDHWQAEESRRATLDQLNRLIEGAADYAILMLDADGRVRTWSQSAERLKRYGEREILGQPYAVFFTPEDRADDLPQRILDEAARLGRTVTHGQRVRGDGTRFWARGVITAQRDDDGTLTGFVKVAHDVTDEYLAKQEVVLLNRVLRELNGDLEQRIADRTEQLERQASDLAGSNRELEAFSYSVSHDLRAPLRAVSGFAQLLVEDHASALDQQGLHYLDRIQACATQMGELIEGLLSFSRVQRQQLTDEPIDMTRLAREAWESVRPDGDTVAFRLADLPPARGDLFLLRQVWVNLLENAVKFTSGSPEPDIQVFARTGEATTGEPSTGGVPVYVVEDNGAGFDMTYAHKLFHPFQRLHRAEDYPGTGIGLALVQRIVSRHGGSIEAEAAPDRGARFSFTLEAPQ